MLASAVLSLALLSPAPPTVALVPTINLSGERWESLRAKQQEKIDGYTLRMFTRRGFQVISALETGRAARSLGLDFTDEEQLIRANMFRLGEAVGADYILVTAIVSTDRDEKVTGSDRDGNMSTEPSGRTDVKVWLLDVKGKEPIVPGRVFTGTSGGQRLGDQRASVRQIQSAENAVRDAIQKFLRQFPEIRTVSR